MSTNNFLMPLKSPDFSLTFTLALAAVVATHAGVYFGFFGAIVETAKLVVVRRIQPRALVPELKEETGV